MAGEDVVIVDGKGAEHHFPAGFDPQRAGAIVRASTETPPSGWSQGGNEAQTEPHDPEWMAKLKAMLETAAHPKSLRDFLGLLIPSEAGAAASMEKLGASAPSVAEAATKAATTPITAAGPTLQEIAVGTAKGLKNAALSPTKTAAGAVAGTVVGGHEGAAIGAVVGATSDILKSIKAEVAERLIANVRKPGNVQAAFKAVQDAAKSRGVKLTSYDVLDVLKDLNKTDGVSLELPKLESGGASAAVSGPNRIGSASYGPRGDLKTWVQQKIASMPKTVGETLLVDSQGNPISYK